jgi:tRNA (cytidine/uridine-2'-O-)-methyltransferase
LPRGICVKLGTRASAREERAREALAGRALGRYTREALSPVPTQPDFYLRTRAVPRPFHIVLVEPEIPPNTGNVARLCAATLCPLHLVGKLGFRIDEHAVRRAGLDYWHLVEVLQHETLTEAEQSVAGYSPERAPRSWFFSGHARRSYLDADFALGDALVFGKESVGLPPELLEERGAQVIGIPMPGHVRSHNLANSVSIAVYEALRQNQALNLI